LGHGRHSDLTEVNNALLATRFNEVLQQIDPKQIANSIAGNPELLFRFAAEESLRQKRETDVIRDREAHEDRKRRRQDAELTEKLLMLSDEKKAILRAQHGKPGFGKLASEMLHIKVPPGINIADFDQIPANS
jgi:hypothetical protein